MKVLVCGSRDWSNSAAIRRYLEQLPDDAVVMHGGARGADRLAGVIAESLGLEVEVHAADWRVTPDTPTGRIGSLPGGGTYDRGAGLIRNVAMLNEQPDLVLAFHLGGSSGTEHTVIEARRRGIPVEVISC
jgi:hypothetical protein